MTFLDRRKRLRTETYHCHHHEQQQQQQQQQQQPLIPHLPVLLLIRHVLPFLDRTAWNHLSIANKELHIACQSLTPPWPHGIFTVSGAVYSVAFSPCSKALALSGSYGMLQVRSIWFGLVDMDDYHDGDGGVNCVSFSENGLLLASAGDDRRVRIWDVSSLYTLRDRLGALLECTRVLLHPHTSHGYKTQCVEFAPDSLTVASGSEDGRIRLWDVATGQLLRVFRGWNRNSVVCLDFSPIGSSIAFGGNDHTIRIKNLQDGSRQSLELNHVINSIAFSPDGTILAVGCRNSSKILLWNMTDSTIVGSLEGHSHSITSLVFDNETRLVSVSEDSSVRFWDISNKQCTDVRKPRARCLLTVAISKDRSTLACGAITKSLCLLPFP